MKWFGDPARRYGAQNAVNGIINIITRDADHSKGGLITAGAGTEERAFGSVRYGGQASPSMSYRVFARYFNREGDVAQAVTLNQFDGDRLNVQFGGRLEWKANSRDTVTLQGEGSDGREHRAGNVVQLTSPYTVFSQKWLDANSGFLMLNWSRKVSDIRQTSLRFYYDRKSVARIDASSSSSNTLDFEYQDNVTVADRHNLVWGLGYRDWIHRSSGSVQRSFTPENFDSQLFTGLIWRLQRPGRPQLRHALPRAATGATSGGSGISRQHF